MKRFVLFILYGCNLISNNLIAQTTWFKTLPGWRAQTNYFNNDTLITIGMGEVGNKLLIVTNYSSLKTGEFYRSDTLDYFQISKDTNTSNEHRTSYQSIYDKDTKKLTIGFNYLDTLKGKYKWQSAIFNTYPLLKLSYKLNHDTFNTKIDGYQKIGKNYYAIVYWVKKLGSLGGASNYQLFKLNKDLSVNLIKQEIDNICANCHSIWFRQLHADNQNQGNLILQTIDQWDWAGSPGSWQEDIELLDTNGKTLWKCRPNTNDSVNTSLLKMVQKPSGNIICSWTDFYHPPHKRPDGLNPYEDLNENATVWMAEIDYKTGKVLWRKNLRKYLFSKFTPSNVPNTTYQDIDFNEAQLVDGNSIVWAGHRAKTYLYPISWKRLAVILKTDLNGDPIWYREHEFFPNDSGDKGMQVFSFTQSPDKGFILSGEYENRYGQASGGEYWQKAALLKLDSFGCRKEGCQSSDGVNKINTSPNICKVYPNPANDKLFIEFPKNQPNGWRYTITNILGKTIKEQDLINQVINIQCYPVGLYFIQLQNINSNHYEIHKISIEH